MRQEGANTWLFGAASGNLRRAATFGPSKDFVGKHKRSADIYNGIDKAKLPAGCRLGLDIVKHGAKTPSLRKAAGLN
jgi:hypothetical protein